MSNDSTNDFKVKETKLLFQFYKSYDFLDLLFGFKTVESRELTESYNVFVW